MRNFLLIATFFSFETSKAFAHHPWEGATLTQWYQGLLSGLAHPVLGPDHLAFLAAVAIFCALFSGGRKNLLAFIPATLAGVLAHLFFDGRFEVPFYETVVVLSVALGGLFVLAGGLPIKAALFFFALSGLFHGYAYGGGIVGAEASPVVFYLAGLVVVQTLFVFVMSFLFSRISRAFSGNPALSRIGFSRAAGLILLVVSAVV